MSGIVAIAAIDIAAPATRVWAALTEPAQIKQYMFGSTIETDWRPSSAITWSGEYNGQRYQDRGQIVSVEPPRRLELTHFSPHVRRRRPTRELPPPDYELTAVEDGTAAPPLLHAARPAIDAATEGVIDPADRSFNFAWGRIRTTAGIDATGRLLLVTPSTVANPARVRDSPSPRRRRSCEISARSKR